MTDYIVPQYITTYIQGGVVHPDDPAEPHNNQPLSTVQPVLADGSFDFSWRLTDLFDTFTSLGIIGFKIVGQFDGSGIVAWSWEIDDPGTWTSGDGSFIAWQSGDILVDGLTDYEHTFALTDTASDPTYAGQSYSDPLGDLEISLHATEDTAGFDHAVGSIDFTGSTGSVQILRLDLVLFTTVDTGGGTTPVARLWPRDDGRGISSGPRLVPAPKANRIVGGYC